VLVLTSDSPGSMAEAQTYIIDNDAASLPSVSVQATDGSASEEKNPGTPPQTDPGVFTISVAGTLSNQLTVYYTFPPPSTPVVGATNGADYTATPASSVTIPAGSSSATVTIQPIDDSMKANWMKALLRTQEA
jgi:hypothetical protein